MSTQLAVYEPETGLEKRSTYDVMPMVFQLADKLHMTDFVPSSFRNKPAALAACMLAGHELGLAPMTAIQHVFSIEGKIGLSAAMQRGLILAHGHQIWIEDQSPTRAIVCARRRDMPDHIFKSTWTLDRAKTANLTGKPMWRLYPENMLVARASSEVARAGFMDVLGAMPYSKEELEDGFVEGLGEPSSAPAPKTVAKSRRMRALRAATEPSEPSPEEVEQAVEALGQADRAKVAQAPEEERAALAVKLWKRMPAEPPVEPEPSPQLESTAARAEPPPINVEAPPEGGAAEPTTPGQSASAEGTSGPATGSGVRPDPSGRAEGPQASPGEPVPAPSSGGPQSSAAEALPQENLSLAQRVAIAAREAGAVFHSGQPYDEEVFRHLLVRAVTGKEKGARGLSRAEAQTVIEGAGAIARGEQVLKEVDGVWMLVTPETAQEVDQAASEGELLIPGLGVVRRD